MIKKMREIAPIVLWIVLVAFIGTIFFAWGMDFASRKREPQVGKVGKTNIPLRYFDRMVSIEREKQRQQAGGDLTPYQSKMIPRQVWETEVSRIVHKALFEKMGLSASPDEVFTYIKNNPPPEIVQHPAFQTDSVFDTSKFVEFLNTPQSFENEGMRQLEAYTSEFLVPMEKLRRLVEIGRVPSRAEIADEYRRRNEMIVFEYAKADPSSFPADTAAITADMVRAYYEANPDSFFAESQAELYYMRIEKQPTAEDEKAYYDEMLAIKSRVENGESTFGEEAKIESDDEGTGKQGGDLGWVSKGSLVPEFEAVAFALDSGNISEPVKTQFGYHLILVEGKREKDSTEEVKVRHILRKVMPTMETLDSLERLVENLRAVAVESGLAAAVGNDTNIVFDSTGLFKKGDFIKGVGYLFGATSFAFREDIETVSDAMENQEAFFLLQLKRRTEKGILALEEVRPKIVSLLADSISQQKARTRLESALAQRAPGAPLTSLTEADSLIQSGVTDTVARNQYVANVGYDNEAVNVAFVMPLQTRSKVVKAGSAFYAVKPLWQKKVMDEDIDWNSEAVQRIAYGLSSAAREKAYYAWYLNQKDKAKIEDNLDEYYMD